MNIFYLACLKSKLNPCATPSISFLKRYHPTRRPFNNWKLARGRPKALKSENKILYFFFYEENSWQNWKCTFFLQPEDAKPWLEVKPKVSWNPYKKRYKNKYRRICTRLQSTAKRILKTVEIKNESAQNCLHSHQLEKRRLFLIICCNKLETTSKNSNTYYSLSLISHALIIIV